MSSVKLRRRRRCLLAVLLIVLCVLLSQQLSCLRSAAVSASPSVPPRARPPGTLTPAVSTPHAGLHHAPGRLAPRTIPETTLRPATPTAPAAPPPPAVPPRNEPHDSTKIRSEIPTPPPPAADPFGEQFAVEVSVGGITRRTMVGYRIGDTLLLPCETFLDLVGARYVVSASGLVAVREPRARETALPSRLVRGHWYAPVDELARPFAARAVVAWDNAAVEIEAADSFPIVLRHARERARERVTRSAASAPPALALAPEAESGNAPFGNDVALDYRLSTSSDAFLSSSSYELGATASLLGGRLHTRVTGQVDGAAHGGGDWLQVWNHQRWLRQLRLGEGLTGGPRPRAVRGIALTNAPFARPMVVEDLPFAGTLPPGWSIEAYRAGQLVAFDTVGAQGRYLLSLPVAYGENPTDFVAYGPFGEVHAFNRTFRALPDMLAAGTFEYAAALGGCADARCAATANLDLRYGAARRWTVRGGVDRLWGRPGGAGHVYAAVTGAPLNAVGLELETLRGVSDRAAVRFEPSARVRLTADWIGYRPGAEAPFGVPGRRSAWSVTSRLVPGGPTSGVTVEAEARQAADATATRTDVRIGSAVRARNLLVRPSLRVERVEPGSAPAATRSFAGLEITALPRPSLGRILGSIWTRGDLELDSRGRATRGSFTASRELAGIARFEAGFRWAQAPAGGALVLGIVTQSPRVRASTVATRPLGGTGRVDQIIAGSMRWNHETGGVAFSAEPASEHGRLGGIVYLDLDANGRRDAAEPALADVRLLVAGQWVSTDDAGRFERDGIGPYESVTVGVDSASLRLPWWMPAAPLYAIEVAPGRQRDVAVPVVVGTILEGRLQRADDQAAPGTASLVLRNVTTGAVRWVMIYSDGSFYETGILPGSYELTAATPDAAAVVSDTISMVVAPPKSSADADATPPRISGIVVTLHAAPTPDDTRPAPNVGNTR